jgi:hypothetical protein
MTPFVRTRRDDAGAYMVLYALLGVAIFAVVALVLDIAALRQGRRADRAAADLAATAGAAVVDPLDPSSFAPACQAAWDYVVLNRDDADGAVTPPDCPTAFPAAACNAAAPATATGTYGPLTVSITYPVPDGDALMRAELAGGDAPQAIDPTRDGLPCQRIAVRIERTRSFLFGGIVGSDAGTTDVHAVARRVLQSGPDVPAAVALDPIGCPAVQANASALRIVPAAPGAPATLVVDTDLTGCAGYALEAPAATGGSIEAGEIEAFALTGPNSSRVRTGNVTPAPVGVTTRLGRSFLDARYNCGPACGEAQGDLDALRAQYGAGVPAGLIPYLGPCTIAGPFAFPPNSYVACPLLQIDSNVTFLGATNVLEGGVHVSASGCLAANSSVCGGPVVAPLNETVLFVRGAVSKEDRGNLVLANTFLYAGGGVTVPRADPLGSSELRLTAPLSGDFEDLAIWTDVATDTAIGEQQSFFVEGTIAAPNSTVVLSAKTGGTPVLNAQVVAHRIRLDQDRPVRLSPSAGRATGAVARQAKLIR